LWETQISNQLVLTDEMGEQGKVRAILQVNI